MNRAAFLDRDGVINEKAPEGQYITRWEDFRFLPGVVEGISLLNSAGFRVVVVSNQRCIAKGLLSIEELDKMSRSMCEELAKNGGRIDRSYYCPHDIYPPCSCRKPAPGMLLAASRALEIDPAESWMIGDSDSDVQAGKSAGCRTARVLANDEPSSSDADICAVSLLDAVTQILCVERGLIRVENNFDQQI